MRFASFLLICLPISFLMLLMPAAASEVVRIGVLKFGTVNWEVETIRGHGLDEANGFRLEPVELASNEAGRIAILAGEIDMIASDWLFVARQRGDGRALAYVPYSSAIGGIMVPPDSAITSIEHLRGARIGVAGGPLDKTWLGLLGLARVEAQLDLARDATPAYGAAPLILAKLEQGELAVALNYWHYNARLAAKGYRELISGQQAMRALGADGDISAVGYVFSEHWAQSNPRLIEAFIAASRQAKVLLSESEAAWDGIRHLMNAEDEPTLKSLRQGFLDGIPKRPLKDEIRDTETVFRRLAEIGGEQLVGSARTLPEGTFWDGGR